MGKIDYCENAWKEHLRELEIRKLNAQRKTEEAIAHSWSMVVIYTGVFISLIIFIMKAG